MSPSAPEPGPEPGSEPDRGRRPRPGREPGGGSGAQPAAGSDGPSGSGESGAGPGPLPGAVRWAALVAAAEGGALLGLGAFYVAKTTVDRPDSYGRALFGASFALAGGALLMLLARGLVRQRGWARTPVVVLQLLALPVGYSLAFQAGLPGYGGPILVLAVAALYLLFTPEGRAAFWREPPGSAGR